MSGKSEFVTLHINEISLEEVKKITGGDVISDGDCGSVWGEYHDCPHPHVLVRNPSKKEIDKLLKANVPFAADRNEVWGDDTEIFGIWMEDDRCPDRTSSKSDYRRPRK